MEAFSACCAELRYTSAVGLAPHALCAPEGSAAHEEAAAQASRFASDDGILCVFVKLSLSLSSISGLSRVYPSCLRFG